MCTFVDGDVCKPLLDDNSRVVFIFQINCKNIFLSHNFFKKIWKFARVI